LGRLDRFTLIFAVYTFKICVNLSISPICGLCPAKCTVILFKT
jgi:hypothetical protein